jgi:hypothetical protein
MQATETMFREVDEDLLKKAALLSAPGNSFQKVLDMGDEYRQAGLTPVYFADDDDKILHVTSVEKLRRGLN